MALSSASTLRVFCVHNLSVHAREIRLIGCTSGLRQLIFSNESSMPPLSALHTQCQRCMSNHVD